MNKRVTEREKDIYAINFILLIINVILFFVVLSKIQVIKLQTKLHSDQINQNHYLINDYLNILEEDYHLQIFIMDNEVLELKHQVEVLTSQLEIIDSAINGRDKRNVRINKLISAIKDTIPGFRSHIDGCSKAPSPGELWSIAGAIIDNADEYAVPASLITAVIKQESAFCNNATSVVGAKGYMQLMPETAAEVSADVAVKTGRSLRTWRGRDNIQLGTAYLSAMLLEFDGNIRLATAAYNAGPNHVKKVLAGLIEERTCSNGLVTPYYCETANYIDKIQVYKEEYDKLGLN